MSSDRCGVCCTENVVGGFAGGERGVKLYVEEGDFIIADPEEGKARGTHAKYEYFPMHPCEL